MFVNCDIGERGADHPVDVKLMRLIGMANIACGGHAGDEESVAAFRRLAAEENVKISAHLSYPDRDNFGRVTIRISDSELTDSLTRQYSLMPDVTCVKFHGALYNDANTDKHLASLLTDWMTRNGIREVVTPFDSELAHAAENAGIAVLAEGFAERRYDMNPETGQLTLTPRRYPDSSITDLNEAVRQAKKMTKEGKVSAFVRTGEKTEIRECPIRTETICIHSDSVIAPELAEALRKC